MPLLAPVTRTGISMGRLALPDMAKFAADLHDLIAGGSSGSVRSVIRFRNGCRGGTSRSHLQGRDVAELTMRRWDSGDAWGRPRFATASCSSLTASLLVSAAPTRCLTHAYLGG